MADAVLRLDDVCAGYVAGLPIVDGVSLEVRHGEIVALFGPNGAGKSTLVKAIAGTALLFAGRISCGATDLAGRKPWQIARAGVGYVPQRGNVFTDMTVQENLALGRPGRSNGRGMELAEVLALFPELAARRGVGVRTLSAGQRQMVAIGRALLGGPAVLLLDEPSAGLSPKAAGQLFAALATLKQRVPILLVEQNVRAALTIADRAILLAEGRTRREATPAALLADPALAGAFLGVMTP
jgi:branched-chain amino acid transport system ATP-binding protein